MPNPRAKETVREKLLGHLESILEDDEVRTGDKLKAIELFGREFGIFVEQKKINIDVNTVVKHLSDGQLTSLMGETHGKQLLASNDAITDVEFSDLS